MTLSETEKDFLERINQALEAYAEPGYLNFIWTDSELLEPESQILRLARNVYKAKEIAWRQRSNDPLTGLWGRSVMFEFLKQGIAKTQAVKAEKVCFALFDVDNMKPLNCALGHPNIGDTALQKMAQTLEKHLQPWHFVGRIGGDEFLAVLNASIEETKAFIEKIQTEIAALVYTVGDPEIRATLSIVLTQITRDDTIESCMARVEGGMQHAKNTRRNDIWIV